MGRQNYLVLHLCRLYYRLMQLEDQAVKQKTNAQPSQAAEPIQQFDMFSNQANPALEKVEQLLQDIDPNELTPRMALEAIYTLKSTLKNTL